MDESTKQSTERTPSDFIFNASGATQQTKYKTVPVDCGRGSGAGEIVSGSNSDGGGRRTGKGGGRGKGGGASSAVLPSRFFGLLLGNFEATQARAASPRSRQRGLQR